MLLNECKFTVRAERSGHRFASLVPLDFYAAYLLAKQWCEKELNYECSIVRVL